MAGLFDDIMAGDNAASGAPPAATAVPAGGGLFDDIMSSEQPSDASAVPFDPMRALIEQQEKNAFESPVIVTEGPQKQQEHYDPLGSMVQGVGKAGADLAGIPLDLPAAATNAATWVWNKSGNLMQLATGQPVKDSLPYVQGSLSDAISGKASEVAESMGVPVQDPAQMDPRSQASYNAARFGLGSVAPGLKAPMIRAPASAKVNPMVEAGERLNIPVPRGLASESKTVQAATQAARQAPIGGGMIEKAADTFLGATEAAVHQTAAMAAGGNASNRAAAGSNLRTAIEGAVDKNRKAQAEPFKALRGHIDDAALVPITDELAGSLNRVMESRVSAGEGALPRDLMPLAELATNPQGANFNGLQRARTTLSERIDFEVSQGFEAADLKAMYGAVTRAMESAVMQTAKTTPEAALTKFRAANAEFARRADTNKGLGTVLRSQSDEALADKVIGMASQGGRANIKQLSMLNKEIGHGAFGELGSVVIGQMGTGPSGKFSFDNLVSNWNKLSAEGKALLFRDEAVRGRLDDIMTLATPAKDIQRKYSNSSNTARPVLMGGLAGHAMVNPISAIGVAFGGITLGKVLASPVTSQSMVRWAKIADTASTRPTPANVAAFRAASETFVRVANDNGVALPLNELLRAIQGSSKAGAEEDAGQR
jgi:hypothetical protein